MNVLEKENGDLLTDQKGILHEVKEYYKTLYSKRPVKDIDLHFLLNNADIPKVSDIDQNLLEGVILIDEVKGALKSMKNNKSPGPDGFTVEFFKFFFIDLGAFLVRSLNFGFNVEKLSVTQCQGLITCIPKDDKPKQYLKNWRPISLLNVTYKIASACIANRLKRVLDKIIGPTQNGFIKGRFIGDNIRLLYDIMKYTEIENIPGMLVMIDFEKAFDSISWSFNEKCLS
jgi:hypothetical protein